MYSIMTAALDSYELSPYYKTLLNNLEPIFVAPYPNFVYDDADDFEAEIAEFYTYAEIQEFQTYRSLYHRETALLHLPAHWSKMTDEQRKALVLTQLEKMDVKDNLVRLESCQVILYIAQGCWEEVDCSEEQIRWQTKNSVLLYKLGVLGDILEQLDVKLSIFENTKKVGNILDSAYLRVVLGVAYTIIEVMRSEPDEHKEEVKEFLEELDAIAPPTITKLCDMISMRTNYEFSLVPVKKTLLTLWKLLLLYLGDREKMRLLKCEARKKFGLSTADDSELVLEEYEKLCETKHREKIPWKQKVSKCDVLRHLNQAREKYFGFTLDEDMETLFGLPTHIVESVEVMKKHMYVPLCTAQMEECNNEEKSRADLLYNEMVGRFKPFFHTLGNIFSLAASSCADEIHKKYNIHAETMPPNIRMNSTYILGFGVDIARQREILIKAISAILFLLLKHYKVNHVYQFEWIAKNLVITHFLAHVLGFIKLDVKKISETKSVIRCLEFPHCVIGGAPAYDTNLSVGRSDLLYSWRNMFALVNLLRVINKIVKYKKTRIQFLLMQNMMESLLVCLTVKNSLVELYTLKLIKMLVKFMGKPWRMNNLTVVSRIYHKVRHRLCDNWLSVTDSDLRKHWNCNDFQLKTKIDLYNKSLTNLVPSASTEDALAQDVSLPEGFEQNYNQWLDQEVFSTDTNWDELIQKDLLVL